MGAPASNGRLCTNLGDMLVGDYIQCEYVAPTANVAGEFKNLGVESTLKELPTAPNADANGYFYFIKVDKGLLIADRMVQNLISWSNLNKNGFISGKLMNGILFRILSDSEFIKYISRSDLDGNIIKQDINVWNCNTLTTSGNVPHCSELVQDSYPQKGAYARMRRYGSGKVYNDLLEFNNGNVSVPRVIHKNCTQATGFGATYNWETSNYAPNNWYASSAFRPVIEYIDNPKSTDIWK